MITMLVLIVSIGSGITGGGSYFEKNYETMAACRGDIAVRMEAIRWMQFQHYPTLTIRSTSDDASELVDPDHNGARYARISCLSPPVKAVAAKPEAPIGGGATKKLPMTAVPAPGAKEAPASSDLTPIIQRFLGPKQPSE
jgi:hypothetical protein